MPERSRLHGVTVQELRLPKLTVVATIIREGKPMTADGVTRLRGGDELLVLVPARDRQRVIERFQRVSRDGRLASWIDHVQGR